METLLCNVMIWVVGAFAVASMLMVFFTTKFTQHIFEVLRKMGYHKESDTFYTLYDPVLDYTGEVGRLTKEDMHKWLLTKGFGAKHPRLAELLTCPGCMSMQLGLWSGLLTASITGDWWWWLVAFLSWPAAGRLIFKRI